jgi:hypothetical protein
MSIKKLPSSLKELQERRVELGIKDWGTKAKIQERIDAKEREISSFFEQASESEPAGIIFA